MYMDGERTLHNKISYLLVDIIIVGNVESGCCCCGGGGVCGVVV
jgi:hypothetical protein